MSVLVSEALKSAGAITLFVEDLPAARSFYERVFGRTAAFGDDSSAGFKFDNTIVNLVDTRATGVVIAPVAVASPSAGSRFLLTIWVDDVDAACAELADQGVGGCSTARWTGQVPRQAGPAGMPSVGRSASKPVRRG